MKTSILALSAILIASSLGAAENEVTTVTTVAANNVIPKVAKAPVKGAYVGLGFGTSTFNDGGISDDVNAELARWGLEEFSTGYSNTGLKLYAGYQFNKVVAVEFSYTDYGTYSLDYLTTNVYKLNPSSIALAVNVGYNFGSKSQFRPFAIAGLSSVNFNENGTYKFYDSSSTGALRLGLGFEYTPIEHLGLRVAYEGDYYTLKDANLNNVSYLSDTYPQSISMVYLGVNYKF